jgi:hypothetical protein
LTPCWFSPSIAPQKNMAFGRFHVLAPLLVAAIAAACSPGPSGPRVPAGGPGLGAPGVPWSGKSHEERQAFMAAHVEPTMRRLFQTFNKKAYSDFRCETCHGVDMEKTDFHMPNSLYALSTKDTIAEATSYDETTTKFMMTQVVPTFAKLLASKAGEPGGPGVTCFTCHPHE